MILPKRKLPRLQGFDYSAENYYYVTLCTYDKKNIFGRPENINEIGKIAERELLNIHTHFQGVTIDKYVIMPNHIHMIVVIGCEMAERSRPFPTLSTVIGLYKSGVSKKVHEIYPNVQVWQKSFFDRIIRDENGYLEVLRYIEENPLKWTLDEYCRERS